MPMPTECASYRAQARRPTPERRQLGAVRLEKVARHFKLDIQDAACSFRRTHDSIAQEAALDGICILRCSLSRAPMDAPRRVRHYKTLADVERAFRSFKTIDLKVRPIHHRRADRARAYLPVHAGVLRGVAHA
jgi:hypothetical protein